jgi:hypothetical protein
VQTVNFQTTNPAQLIDRVTELQIAAQLDEANNLAEAVYTGAGAIALGGVAILAAGGTSAAAMTLASPLAGAQSAGGNDGMRMKIISADAALYTITAAADSIDGAYDTISFGSSTSIAGIGLELTAYNGKWYTGGSVTLAASKTNGTVTLQEV